MSQEASEEKKVKRRRLQGSCDTCRRKKSDSSERPNQPCTNCVTFKSECTHSRSKGSDKASADSSKTGQDQVAKILSTSSLYIPSNDPNVSHEMLVEVAKYARQLEETVAGLRRELRALTKSKSSVPSMTPGVGGGLPIYLQEPGANLVQSSAKTLVQSPAGGIGHKFLRTALKNFYGNTTWPRVIRRPEFWGTQPWQRLISVDRPHQSFPEDDLLTSLVDIYFEQINPLLGILHPPSFRQSISDDLHLHDEHFGAVVLAACALGSRYSDDPRVFLEGVSSEPSRGWKWFRQVQPLCATFSQEHSLHQLQLICLSINFLTCTGIPAREQCWILAGLGIRFAHAAGAHNRRAYTDVDPVTAELYKRAFWLLVVQDTMMSSFSGRSSMAQPPDFDLDLPVTCGHTYAGIQGAVQPGEQLDNSVFMVIFLQLMTIFRRIQDAVYPANGQVYSQNVVVELDSALNSWLDGIPHHLRWDPHQQNQTFLNQSAALYSTYYHAQILIHRPFIPTPGKGPMPDTKFPSLAICAAAARSCGHVLEVQARRGSPLHLPSLVFVLFDCAVVLLVNVWAVGGGLKTKSPEDFSRATADVQICAHVLRLYEQIWPLAGKKYDIISTMLSVGKYLSSTSSKLPHMEREASFPGPPPPGVSDVGQMSPRTPPVAESSTASVVQPTQDPQPPSDHLYSLPLSTDELGRLPIYDPFHYEFTFHYQPDFHTEPSLSSVMQPESFNSLDLDIGFVPDTQEDAGIRNGEEIQEMQPPWSTFNPSDYGWQDWSAYIESMGSLN